MVVTSLVAFRELHAQLKKEFTWRIEQLLAEKAPAQLTSSTGGCIVARR